jgi:hypothetical protein
MTASAAGRRSFSFARACFPCTDFSWSLLFDQSPLALLAEIGTLLKVGQATRSSVFALSIKATY